MLTAILGASIHNSDVPNQGDWLEKKALIIAGDKIHSIVPEDKLPASVSNEINLKGARVVPGFFDTQVNGGGGVLLNDHPTAEGIKTIAEAHAAFGTTAMLPTLISDDLSVMRKAITATQEAITQGVSGIMGLHLEGPFLNPLRKGVHNPEKFTQLGDDSVELISSLNNGRVLLTLAPEQTTPEMIERLCANGVTVSAGHTAANYEQALEGLNSGITAFTHLFNAMTPLTSREPGCVGAALEDKNSWCGIIVDGYHVHDTPLKMTLELKPRGKVVLVTDAMPTVGSKDKRFTLNGEIIEAEGGRCATARGTLAGSDLDMMSAVRNTVLRLGVNLAEAVRMASLYPAQMMGVDKEIGSLAPGKKASFLAIENDLSLSKVWINGIAQNTP